MKTVKIYKKIRITKYKSGLYGIFKGNMSISIFLYRTIKECEQFINHKNEQ